MKLNAELGTEAKQDLNSILDYIWCRLSEKYVKLSKAFRNMDLTIVAIVLR
jgi:hypothetical protein